MELAEALNVLGVGAADDWATIRRSYRSQLRTQHPDITSDPNASATTARLVEAFGVVSEATERGATPLATVLEVRTAESTLPAVPVILYTGPGDVYTRLRGAMEEIGEVSYADRFDRIVQIAIHLPGTSASHLTAEVIEDDEQVCVLFTLDPLTNGEPPALASVVASLTPHLI